jgi:hypothetical protein
MQNQVELELDRYKFSKKIRLSERAHEKVISNPIVVPREPR